MRSPSVMRTNPDPTTVTFHLPVLDDATAVVIYNFLCEFVDRFDSHYGKQICHFYALQEATHVSQPPPSNPNDPLF